jgi:hypothetical protein
MNKEFDKKLVNENPELKSFFIAGGESEFFNA